VAASDFRAVPGTKRARFENAAGVNISRRAYEDLRARERGAVSYRAAVAAFPRAHPENSEYERHLGHFSAEDGVSRKSAMRAGSVYNQLFAAAYIKPDGTIRTEAETYQNAEALYWLLQAEGFVGEADYSRYVKR
jgi:hypothetical protein